MNAKRGFEAPFSALCFKFLVKFAFFKILQTLFEFLFGTNRLLNIVTEQFDELASARTEVLVGARNGVRIHMPARFQLKS